MFGKNKIVIAAGSMHLTICFIFSNMWFTYQQLYNVASEGPELMK